MGKLIRGLSENGGIVFCGVDSTDVVCKAEQLHTTSATCSAALGRLLTGASLMGSMLKDDRDTITLRVSGNGPAGVVIACTDGTGNVKGCIDHPLVELVPTVCALGVLVDKDLSISCAGGYLLQLLPGATDAEITQLEQNIAAMPSVTEMLHAGKTPEDMMNLAMAGFNPSVLDEREVRYQCDCSRERTEQMLLSLGRKELEKLRDEDPHCEVVCHFCHTKYEFDLNKLVKKAVEKAAPASENAEN